MVILAAASCAHAAEAHWVKIQSPHFTVFTDASEKQGREVALRFEQMRAVFGVLFSKVKVQDSQPNYIIAFRHNKDFKQISPVWKGAAENLAGWFQPSQGITYIALDLSSQGKWNTIFHEYSHALLNANVPPMPPWFDEGFAEYFSTVNVVGKDIEVGALPESVPYVLNQSKWLPIADLFSVDHSSADYNESNRQGIFYAESWLAMHYLWFDRSRTAATIKYLQFREAGVPVADAIRKAYGVEPRELDKQLGTYFRTGRALVYRYPTPAELAQITMTASPLSDLDVRARIADLCVQSPDHLEDGMKDLDAVLQQNPNDAVALRAMGYGWLRKGDQAKAGEYFGKAAGQDSQDPQVFYLSAVLLSREGPQNDPALVEKMQTALKKAIKLDANLGDAWNWLSITYAWQDKFDDAITAARRAVELSPRNDQLAMNLASYYERSSKFDRAVPILENLLKSTNPAVAGSAKRELTSIEAYQHQQKDMLQATANHDYSGNNAQPQATPIKGQAPVANGPSRSTSNDSDVLNFFAGTLSRIDCVDQAETIFSVISGTQSVELVAPSLSEVEFSGKTQFSCALHDRKVKGFYKNRASGKILVAIEFE